MADDNDKHAKRRSQNTKAKGSKQDSATRKPPSVQSKAESKKEPASQIAQSLDSESKKTTSSDTKAGSEKEKTDPESGKTSRQRLKCFICLLMVAIPALLIVFGIIRFPETEQTDQYMPPSSNPIEETPLIEDSNVSPQEQNFAEAAIEDATDDMPDTPRLPPAVDETELYPEIPIEDSRAQIPDDPQRAAMMQRINELEGMVEQQMQAVQQAIAREEARARESQRERNIDPLIIALLQLRERLDKGLPLETDFALIGRLGQFDQPIGKTLQDLQSQLNRNRNVVSYTELEQQFDTLIFEVIQAEKLAEAKSWWDRFLGWLYSIFSIRPVGDDIIGPSTEAAISRAEHFLLHNQLDRAIEEMSQLDGPAAEVLQSWLEQARLHQQVEKLMTSLLHRSIKLAMNETENKDYQALLKSLRETINNRMQRPLEAAKEGELPQRLPNGSNSYSPNP